MAAETDTAGPATRATASLVLGAAVIWLLVAVSVGAPLLAGLILLIVR